MRLFAVLFSLISLGVGVTLLGFLWLSPFNEFGSPPLFFRVFASFIAFGFILFGAAGIWTAQAGSGFMKQFGDQRQASRFTDRPGPDKPPASQGYSCKLCGAPLDQSADVSPLGDVKCSHCGKWFNIHSA